MNKLILSILVLLLSALIKVDSLQCYVCDNCSEVKAGQLMTCGVDTTTQSPSTISPGTGTTPTGTTATSTETPPTSTASPTTESTTASTTTVPSSGRSADPELQGPRVKRGTIRVQERAIEYVCVTVTLEDTNTVHRGCAVDNGKVCDVSDISMIGNITCTSCNTDKCNSAASVQVSAMLVLAAAILKFV